MMPIMNGWEFYELISRDKSVSSIPVVVMSAQDTDAYAGTLRLLRKPLALDQAAASRSKQISASGEVPLRGRCPRAHRSKSGMGPHPRRASGPERCVESSIDAAPASLCGGAAPAPTGASPERGPTPTVTSPLVHSLSRLGISAAEELVRGAWT